MKNIIINGTTYNDISNVIFNTDTGEQASYKEESEISSGGSSNPFEAQMDLGNPGSYLFCKFTGESLDEYFTDSVKSRMTALNGSFMGCSNITSIDLQGVAKATSLRDTFNGCNNLQTINWGDCVINNATSMESTFLNCKTLTSLDLTSFTTRTTSFKSCFNNCEKLETINLPSEVGALAISDATGMFNRCKSLATINGLGNVNGTEITNTLNMFRNCESLVSIDLSGFDLGISSSMNNCNCMFQECLSLTEIIGVLDLINIASANNMFYNCFNLQSFTLKNIRTSLDISQTIASDETLLNIAKELHSLSTNYGETLTVSASANEFYANNYIKLVGVTEEQIAADPYITNKKPCEVCQSTDEGAMTVTDYIISKNWNISVV